MMGKRNAYMLAALARKAGPHSGARRPDVFDDINEYTDEQLKELYERKGQSHREIVTGKAPLIEQDFGVGDRVRIRVQGPFLWCEGLVVKRDENLAGDPVWTVDMEGAGMACFLTHELDGIDS